MKESLVKDEMLDLICTMSISGNLKAVLPVYFNYFFNKNMSDLIDGEYTVVGKATRVILPNSEDSINLLRNTSFDLLKREVIEDIFTQLNNGQNEQLNMPEINTYIVGPSMLVIPIAIYS